LSVGGYLRLTLAEARGAIASVCDATSGWQSEKAALNLPSRENERMAEAFETDQRRAANHIEP
jgi:hypothetical protein